MSGKTAIVIGASRGIGLGLARELADRGYKVIATERSQSEGLRDAAAKYEPQIEIATCDVTEKDSVAGLTGKCDEGSVDLLIVNAGIYGGDDQALDDLTRESVADILETNAVGPAQAALALLPLVKDGGTIGMMSSKMGSIDDSSGGVNLYRLSKVSQNMLSRSLFENHAKARGVGVISLHPGWVQTDMGGPNAMLDVKTSVIGMLDLLEAESEPRHIFLAYDGSTVPW
ncbi:SDR family NAD(P)-dependent oxidoreductase [Aurantiacibacter aquimixticola]|uniref:SDR family NAD(P)-dependent oxidoreductase n=1 Tax=Aurantiacibacter aquimixticola TaxID=1958945 RepID=A0A419RVC7_9SPHN|nr:SDR family NAD(P)-dependent oxidoreductase [Aurantiacibacter aquimixticola]RJY09720.1 SDR family NAD(P)-dependent oxidoreductase [Aurantiacibacter aquimixticola]